MNSDRLKQLIELLGEDAILRAFDVAGEEKISFSYLRSCIRRRNIIKALEHGGSVSQIARQFSVSRMTVYRIFHQNIRSAPK